MENRNEKTVAKKLQKNDVSFDCYSNYLRLTRSATDTQPEFTVDVIIVASTIIQNDAKTMTVNVLPVFRRMVEDGNITVEAHQYMNKNYLSFSFGLHIAFDPTYKTEIAEFLIKKNISFPIYLKSCGITSFVFSKLIEWGKSVAPSAIVKTIIIDKPDPEDKFGKERRINFFRKHGFDCTIEPDTEKLGIAKAENLGQLKSGINPAKVLELDTITHEITNIINEANGYKTRLKTMRDGIDKMKREASQIREKKNIFLLAFSVALVLLILSWVV